MTCAAEVAAAGESQALHTRSDTLLLATVCPDSPFPFPCQVTKQPTNIYLVHQDGKDIISQNPPAATCGDLLLFS